MNFKYAVRQLIRRLGWDVHRYVPPFARPINRALEYINTDLVVDVGANAGQFVQNIREGGYTGNVVSFEPLSVVHATLLQASRNDPGWEIAPRCALGDHVGQTEINISGNTLSSSILPMLESHRRAAPSSEYKGSERVALETLDSAASPYMQNARSPFLKIDVQGYEWQVLDGAIDTLSRYRGILVELSLVPLYEGQHLWLETIRRMQESGFTLWSITPVFHDPANGRTLQVDGLFLRDK